MRAYLVVGPESSGNRYLVSLLVSGGCSGIGGHDQPFDGPVGNIIVLEPKPEHIAMHRSFPHGNRWLGLDVLIDQLADHGYQTTVLIAVRDPSACVPSQILGGHTKTIAEAEAHIDRAYREIFAGLERRPTDHILVPYASTGTARFRNWLAGKLQLPRVPAFPFVDRDARYQWQPDGATWTIDPT